MVQIKQDIIKKNPYSRPGIKNDGVKGVVMHYTASPGASAQNIRNYFNGTIINEKRYASAHYAVDKNEIIQMLPDNEVAYHAHDRSRCYVDAFKPNANFTSIGVEMCIERDWTLHPDTVKNAIELVRYLSGKYGFGASRIYRHYDVTGKNCPAMWVSNPSLFTKFKNDVASVQPASVHKEAFHVVESGDTLWEISQKYGVSVATIESLNPEVDASNLQIGSTLVLRELPVVGEVISTDVWTMSKPISTASYRVQLVQKGDKFKVYGLTDDHYVLGGSQYLQKKHMILT